MHTQRLDLKKRLGIRITSVQSKSLRAIGDELTASDATSFDGVRKAARSFGRLCVGFAGALLAVAPIAAAAAVSHCENAKSRLNGARRKEIEQALAPAALMTGTTSA